MTLSRRPLRIALIAFAAVLVLSVGVVAVVIASFDPNAYKSDIIRAVQTATGRDLGLNGRISLKASLWPTIQVSDVTFSNPPGFSRPQMASLQSMELRLALLPLLSHQVRIDRVVLVRPDILLERDATGQPNWQMAPASSPLSGAVSTTRSEPTVTPVSVGSLRIQDGTLAYRDDRDGKVITLALPMLDMETVSPASPVHIAADASYDGTAFSVVGEIGALSRLQDKAATSPWPVKLALTIAGASIAADGTLTQPLQGRGYDLTVQGTIPDAATLAPLLPGITPPPLHDLTFRAKLVDAGSALPLVSATGKLGDQTVSLTATTGKLALLMPDAKPQPFPVDAAFQAGEASLSAKGSIADVRAMTGVNLAVAARIPDLSSLSPLVRQPLPAVRQIAFTGTLTDAPGGLRTGAILHSFSLTGPDGDLSGDVSVSLAARRAVAAVLQSSHLDLDALQTKLDQMPAAAPAPVADRPAPTPSPLGPKRGERLFSDQPIPFDLLQSMDADIKLDIADLRSGAASYKAIDTHLVLRDGKLVIAPFAGDLPGGHLSGTAEVDANQPAPPVHLVLHAPGLALKSVLAAAHQPSFASGNLEVYADLRGAGSTPHAIAASLGGSLGLAIAGGTIDNRLLGSVLGKVMDTFNALNLVGKGGVSDLKCFGLRMDAEHGVGRLDVLALSSSLLTMTGTGTVNLGEETLALSLRPQARVAGTGVVIPIDVRGPIRSPSVAVNRLGAAESNAGTIAGAVIADATPLGIVGGLLGENLIGGKADMCPAALAVARGQKVPQAAAAKPGALGTMLPDAGAILKNLFR